MYNNEDYINPSSANYKYIVLEGSLSLVFIYTIRVILLSMQTFWLRQVFFKTPIKLHILRVAQCEMEKVSSCIWHAAVSQLICSQNRKIQSFVCSNRGERSTTKASEKTLTNAFCLNNILCIQRVSVKNVLIKLLSTDFGKLSNQTLFPRKSQDLILLLDKGSSSLEDQQMAIETQMTMALLTYQLVLMEMWLCYGWYTLS